MLWGYFICGEVVVSLTPSGKERFVNNAFWVHILGLPRECFSLEVGSTIGAMFGEALEVKIRDIQSVSY